MLNKTPHEMKVCSKCNRSNEQIEKRCVYCEESLDDAESIPWVDPWEESWSEIWAGRRAKRRKEFLFISLLYVLAIDLTAMLAGSGFGCDLLWFSLSALLVIFGICRGILGSSVGAPLQGLISAVILASIGLSIVTPFVIAAHVILPAVFSFWVEGVREL